MALTICFFGIFLIVLLVRLARTLASTVVQRLVHWPRTEGALHEATEALALAPMLSILLVSARMRTLQADPDRGSSPIWAQICMYAGTCFLLVRLILAAVAGFVDGDPQAKPGLRTKHVIKGIFFVFSLLIFTSSAAIMWYTLTLEGSVAPVPPMVVCVVVLIGCYLLEHLSLEAVGIFSDDPAASGVPCIRLRAQEDGLEDDDGDGTTKESAIVESMSLQFPLMFCVLLVAITLRAIQLKLKPEPWAYIAMYVTTGAFILQVACSTAMGMAQIREESCGGARATWLQLWDRSFPNEVAPGGPDAGAGFQGAQMEREGFPISACRWTCWSLVMVCLYVGTAFVLASVLIMEDDPLSAVAQEAPLEFVRSPRSSLVLSGEVPPISASVRCVMVLVVVYFITHFCLCFMCARVWALAVLSGIQRSLAFTPMLCVMMLAVRLRAMFLRLQDPQPWAQVAMYVATFAVVTQVGCSALPHSSEGWSANDGAQRSRTSTAVKIGIIVLLIIRYVASVAQYLSVAVLIAALLAMKASTES
jgi:hypothetical protein